MPNPIDAIISELKHELEIRMRSGRLEFRQEGRQISVMWRPTKNTICYHDIGDDRLYQASRQLPQANIIVVLAMEVIDHFNRELVKFSGFGDPLPAAEPPDWRPTHSIPEDWHT